ncbi:MAG: HD domain-containing phosphohydrolase [Planctomycetota bacterium]
MAKRIVLADDEAHVLDVLSMKLTKAGFEVLTAHDGQQALELCQAHVPDLLITDCQMPRLDGLGLCTALQDSELTRRIPRIMLTAREFEIDSGQLAGGGISAILSKPFSPRQVLEKAVELLPAGAVEPGQVAVATKAEPNQTHADPNPAGSLVDLARRIQPRLDTMGAVMSIWDITGTCLHKPARREYCTQLCQGGSCDGHHQALSASAVATGQASLQTPEDSCCMMAIPVCTEGRVAGAAVVSVPVQEIAQPEQARQTGWFSRHQAQSLLEMLGWLIESEQAKLESDRRLHNASTNLSLTYEELELVYSLSSEIRINQSPEDFLKHLCNQLARTIDAKVAAVVYPHSVQEQELAVLSDDLELNEEQVRNLVAGQIAPQLSKDKAGWIDNSFSAPAEMGLGLPVNNCLAAALVNGEDMSGILVCLNKSTEFDSVDLKLAGAVGGQTTAFLTNRALFADMEDLFLGVLRSLAATIDAKDAYTGQHSDRVARLSKTLAQRSGLSDDEVREVHLAGMLHDIGKIGVPESILCKPDKLTDEEFEELKKHPGIGAKILSGIRRLDGVVEGILSHHERPDGRGYPRGLKGDQVPISGRIICLADSFDAMASNRPYRDALPMDVVVEEIKKWSGKQFDEKLVEIFLTLDLDQFTD